MLLSCLRHPEGVTLAEKLTERIFYQYQLCALLKYNGSKVRRVILSKLDVAIDH